MAMSTSDSQCKCTLALERGGSVALACTTSVFVYVPNFYPGRHAPFVREATTKETLDFPQTKLVRMNVVLNAEALQFPFAGRRSNYYV